jgi:hypothetical protein
MLSNITLSFKDSLAWINSMQSDSTPPRIRSGFLPIKNVNINLEVFQCRQDDSFGEVKRLSKSHIEELRERLKLSELDAITVFNVGGSWYVIDGHHRLEAYRLEGRKQIPVTVFKGNAKDALFYGVKENSKSKISLTKEQRSELCWRFIIEDGGISKSETANAFSVSERLVGYMRSRYKELGTDALELRWWEAKRTEVRDEDRDTGSKEECLSKQLYELLGTELLRDTRVVAKALARLGSFRFEGLLRCMLNEMDELNEREINYLKKKGDEEYNQDYLDNILRGLSYSQKPGVVEVIEEEGLHIPF